MEKILCLILITCAFASIADATGNDVYVSTGTILYHRYADTLGDVSNTDGVGNHRIALLSNGNLITASDTGYVTLRKQSDFSIITTKSWNPITAVATYAGGKIAFATSDGNLLITDNNLNVLAQLGAILG